MSNKNKSPLSPAAAAALEIVEAPTPKHLAQPVDTSAFVQTADATWFTGIKLERIVTLQDGQGIRGHFLGAGGPVDVSDPVTGEVKALGTWRILVAPNIVCRLLDSAQLRSEFANLRGDGTVRVRVIRVGVAKTGRGRNVTQYVVGTEVES